MSGLRARGWENVAALGACLAFSWFVSRRLLEPNVFSDDALVHQFWMWQWRDPALFTDGLTELLRGSTRYPDGYEALFRLGTHLAAVSGQAQPPLRRAGETPGALLPRGGRSRPDRRFRST